MADRARDLEPRTSRGGRPVAAGPVPPGDLRVYAQPLDGEVFHYRDQSGLEVDAIVDTGDQWAAFEIKLGSGQVEQAAKNLHRFANRVDTASSP